MYLCQWSRGLKEHYFPEGAQNVRLFDADGLVFQEVYNQRRPAGMPMLDKDRASEDFFRAVIQEVFLSPEIVGQLQHHRTRLTEVVQILKQRGVVQDGHNYYDWRLLPLCVFLAAVWSFEFQDEDVRGHDDDYRTRRLPELVRWANGGDVMFEYPYLTQGIINAFQLLAQQYGNRLYMPPQEFEYGGSRANGITISHAVFRWGEIAFLYTLFHDYTLHPHQEYDFEYFRRISENSFDAEWLNRRGIDRETLTLFIKSVFDSWDGRAPERYRNFIRRQGAENGGPAPGHVQNLRTRCRAYWAIKATNIAGWPVFEPKVFISGIDGNIGTLRLSPQEGDPVEITAETFAGRTSYDVAAEQFANRGGVRLFGGETPQILSSLPAFDVCFDRHAVLLLQSYTPPEGGNPIWRLMVGTQGVELWGGDARPANPRYALLASRELRENEVRDDNGAVNCQQIGELEIHERHYRIFELGRQPVGALFVIGDELFNFGVPHEMMDVRQYWQRERYSIYPLYDRDDFVAMGHTTVFYMQKERKIAIYYRSNGGQAQNPNGYVYAIYPTQFEYCEIEPMNSHRVELVFDPNSGLWISDYEDGENPAVIGILSEDLSKLHFLRVGDAIDYQNDWRGYFLPRLTADDNLVITGAFLVRGLRKEIHSILFGAESEEFPIAEGEDEINQIHILVRGLSVQHINEKKEFIQCITQPLRTRLLSGEQHICLANVLPNIPAPFVRAANVGYQDIADYLILALVMLSVYSTRIDALNARPRYAELKSELMDFLPNPEQHACHYRAMFVCEAIVHAILDGIDDNVAVPRLQQCVALANRLVSRWI